MVVAGAGFVAWGVWQWVSWLGPVVLGIELIAAGVLMEKKI
jgi:hypothetical protein